jgi:DNA polymerase-3 subunit delta'
MKTDDAPPEADRVDGAPHPRDCATLYGQDAAQGEFLDAFNNKRMHHGWLITGPRGVGKATLAWRIARFLLDQPGASNSGMFGDTPTTAAQTLEVSRESPIARRIAALSEPRLFLVRRPWDEKTSRLKKDIGVDEIRKLKGFFNLSAADGGPRVVIVDAADEMTINAANALLKLLEEPPDDATILLVSHQPSRLLPTIRSRCRQLRCASLTATDMAAAMSGAGSDAENNIAGLSELSGGSVGEAVRMANADGMQTYGALIAVFSTLPQLDRQLALKLAESTVGRANEARLDLVLRLVDLFLVRVARAGVSGPPLVEASPGEANLLQRLAKTPDAGRKWAELQQKLSGRAQHARAVNLDPAALILDIIFKINELAAELAVR